MVYALAADISIIKLLISCSKYGLYLTAVKINKSLQFDIQISFGYKYAVRCHRHANNTEWHSPWFVNSYDVVDWQWNWLHVQGRYIVFDDTVADPTDSFSSVEHLCVSRQSLTDTELFQFEWVPDQSKSEYDHPSCCDNAASIAFSHAEYTEKIKSW